jgi:hypothetical protein
MPLAWYPNFLAVQMFWLCLNSQPFCDFRIFNATTAASLELLSCHVVQTDLYMLLMTVKRKILAEKNNTRRAMLIRRTRKIKGFCALWTVMQLHATCFEA